MGIIGPSWWVDYWHLPAILNHPDAEIVALCGARPRDSADIAAKYGNGKELPIYTDLDRMLDEVEIDGVVVHARQIMFTHPATMAALNRGIHVTCEKPIALNADQAREMASAAAAKGLVGMSNFPYRGNPAAIELRKQIESGYVGKVLHVSGQYHGGFRPAARAGLARFPQA